SSAIKTIIDSVTKHGFKTISTREPGGTPMAEAIRDCVKANWQEQVTQEAELLLSAAQTQD
ncbi:MAG: dTMP kinase, partial [Pseudoalteromonas spongiae]